MWTHFPPLQQNRQRFLFDNNEPMIQQIMQTLCGNGVHGTGFVFYMLAWYIKIVHAKINDSPSSYAASSKLEAQCELTVILWWKFNQLPLQFHFIIVECLERNNDSNLYFNQLLFMSSFEVFFCSYSAHCLIASTGTRYTIAVYAIYHYCCWIQSLFLSLSFILFAPKRKGTQNRRMHIIRSAAFVWIDWILQRLVFPFFFLCAHFSHTAPHNYSVSLHGKLNRTRIQFALLFPVPGERRRKKNYIKIATG